MMGVHTSQKELFSYVVDLDRRVHADHPLRRVQAKIDFTFARALVRHAYGANGNESVDPAVLLNYMSIAAATEFPPPFNDLPIGPIDVDDIVKFLRQEEIAFEDLRGVPGGGTRFRTAGGVEAFVSASVEDKGEILCFNSQTDRRPRD